MYLCIPQVPPITPLFTPTPHPPLAHPHLSCTCVTSELVPCDCLLLRGSAVVNEASLTGESVPQMKEALGGDVRDGDGQVGQGAGGADDIMARPPPPPTPHPPHPQAAVGAVGADEKGSEPCLDMNGLHRVHTLFSGTSLVTVDGATAASGLRDLPPPPDQGAVAYVLRTGFSSSQVCVCVCVCPPPTFWAGPPGNDPQPP